MFSDSSDFDPIQLSAELYRVKQKFVRFLQAPLSAENDPFSHREFPGLSTFRSVMKLHESDPLRGALLRNIAWLTDERVHVLWTRKEAELERRAEHPVREPVEAALSLKTIRDQALSGHAHTVHQWWRSYESAERPLSEHRLERFLRWTQVYDRLGIQDGFAFWNPVSSNDEFRGLLKIARDVLSETNDASENFWGQGWVSFVEAALGRGAPEGWPARLAPDSMRELLSAPELFRGILIEPGQLPSRFAPISFARAGARIGRALSLALRPSDLPPVLAFDPADVSGHLSAQLFLSWMLSRPFLKRRLRMTRETLGKSRRHYAAAHLAHLRLSAARILVMECATRGPRAVREEFGEMTVALLGRELPPSAALSRFSVRWDEPARFAALLAAADREQQLIDEHDEDWFENPRAQEQLRAEWSTPCATQCRGESLQRGFVGLKTRIFADL